MDVDPITHWATLQLEAEIAAALQLLAPDELGQQFHFKTGDERLQWQDIKRAIRREIICAHEAGHALIAEAEGMGCPTVKVARSGHFGIADGNVVADALPLDDDWNAGEHRDVAIAAIRMKLAGGVAQAIHLRRVYDCTEVTTGGRKAKWLQTGTDDDLSGALGVALTMVPGRISKAVSLVRRCRADVLRWFRSPAGSKALERATDELAAASRLTHRDIKRILAASKRGTPRVAPEQAATKKKAKGTK